VGKRLIFAGFGLAVAVVAAALLLMRHDALPALHLDTYDDEHSTLREQPSQAQLTIENRGRVGVRISQLRVDAPGTKAHDVDLALAPQGHETLLLPIDLAACPPELTKGLSTQPTHVIARVAIADGRTGTVRIPLHDGRFGLRYLWAQQDHCHAQTLDRSFREVSSSAHQGILTLRLHNDSLFPREILSGRDAFGVTSGIVAQTVGVSGDHATSSLTLSVHVLDCSLAKSSRSPGRPWDLALTVRGDGTEGRADIYLSPKTTAQLDAFLHVTCP
jgi:hypothetical protein